jgi:uracil-DNA glycosylase family 4
LVDQLFEAMVCTVTAYGPGAVKVHRRVDGTAFFPGGIGLWRGLEPHGDAPSNFPQHPVMILGHNFDKVAGLEASWKRGVEKMGGATWLILQRYLEVARVDKLDCFFTNVLVGLQPVKSPGKMVAGTEYYEQCRAFLHRQIELVKPRLVATLGIRAEEQYLLSGCKTPHVSLVHPMYPFTLGRDGEKCAVIVESEAAKLREALNALAA